jgi:hypothetical protein
MEILTDIILEILTIENPVPGVSVSPGLADAETGSQSG